MIDAHKINFMGKLAKKAILTKPEIYDTANLQQSDGKIKEMSFLFILSHCFGGVILAEIHNSYKPCNPRIWVAPLIRPGSGGL